MNQEIWKRFIKGDDEALRSMSKKIALSWQACYANNINPYATKPQKILTVSELKKRQKQNQRLIQLVEKEVQGVKDILNIKKPLFVLTDAKGSIIWRDGNYQSKDYANAIYFKEGSSWQELDVGTNAIGMALKSKKEEVIGLNEHYSAASRNWGCASAPIFDDENQLVGILDVSTYQNDSAKEALFFLTAITQKISNQLIRAALEKKQLLLSYRIKMTQEDILCDLHYKVVYVPEKYQENFLVNQDIREQLGKEMIYQQEEIQINGSVIGYRVTLYYCPTEETTFYYAGVKSQNKQYNQFLAGTLKIAKSELPIHIYGESGSGKEIVAKTIHYNSKEKNGPLVAINCGAVNENLLESELFGYAAGAFTGASGQGYQGKIEQADNGTLFLDEIDSMSEKMQAALLRVLEEKKVTPLSGKPKEVSFRLITASNQDLRQKVKEGKFREDLFYRIYVGKLDIPPLRQRLEDLIPLTQAFCHKKNWKISWQDKIIQEAQNYSWPGNIREYQNFLARLYVFYESEIPSQEQLRELIQTGSLLKEQGEPSSERKKIYQALEKERYHISNAAKSLGVSRATFYRRMKEYGIDPQKKA